jgi:hypothetical protein
MVAQIVISESLVAAAAALLSEKEDNPDKPHYYFLPY